MYAKCTKCRLDWNISIKTDLSKPYVCPYCEQKILNAKTKGEKHRCIKGGDRVTKVLLRNKSKFTCL